MAEELFETTNRVLKQLPLDADELFERQNKYFETKLIDSQDLLEAAQALRYQVYCLERNFEDPNEHHRGLERDQYDRDAVHGLLFYRPTDTAMGTVRMILPGVLNGHALPIEEILSAQGLELSAHLPVQAAAEISRFAISKDLRRRHDDDPTAAPSVPRLDRLSLRRDGNLPCLSLIRFLVAQSSHRNISYWAAVMEPKLLRMLAAIGIRFNSIGGLVMHHGLRQPSYCHVPTMLQEMRLTHPHYWNILTNRGEFSARAEQPLKMAI